MDNLSTLIPSGSGVSNFGGGGPSITINPNDSKLCEACRTGNYDKAKKAIEDGANPSAQFRLALGEITPIFLCASKGYREIAELLISSSSGSCINHRIDFDGTICLHHAASNNQSEMCEYLISSGCDVNARDKIGRTPLMDAAEIGSSNVITILSKFDADVNAEDKEHYTALSYCMDFISSSEPKYFECAVQLVELGANPNYPGKYAKRTLLHIAAAKGDITLCQSLCEQYGAAIRMYDNDGKSPINYAADYDKKECVEYLQQRLNQQTSGCCTIL